MVNTTSEYAGEDVAVAALTAREVQVLRLVAEGKRNREIGAALGIRTNTVDRHVSSILKKAVVPNRAAAAAYAARIGLVL